MVNLITRYMWRTLMVIFLVMFIHATLAHGYEVSVWDYLLGMLFGFMAGFEFREMYGRRSGK